MKTQILAYTTLLALSAGANAAVISNFNFTGPPWTAAKQSDFATFSTNAGSVDTELNSTTSNLSKTADIDSGGYSSYYIRDADISSTIYSGTTTSGVGMNFADVAEGAATDYISFTVAPTVGFEATYTNLTLFAGTYDGKAEFELRAFDGATETSLAAYSFTDPNGATLNDPITAHNFEFTDFTSSDTMEFRLYAFDAVNENSAVRLDDIQLNGTVVSIPEPSAAALLGLGGLALILRRRK